MKQVARLKENKLTWIASGTVLAMRSGVIRDFRNILCVLVHPREDIAQKTTEMMGIEKTGQ